MTNFEEVAERINHRMIIVRPWATGAEEWYCPLCARRLVILGQQEILLDPGDSTAMHFGPMGNIEPPRPVGDVDEGRMTDIERTLPELKHLWKGGSDKYDWRDLGVIGIIGYRDYRTGAGYCLQCAEKRNKKTCQGLGLQDRDVLCSCCHRTFEQSYRDNL